MISSKLPSTLLYGGDYNPEQWPEAIWAEDARLMKEAGVNVVSVGIFSWARIQPDEHTFDFGWLDRVFETLFAQGVYVCLATCTASPPAWMWKNYPDILPEDASGIPYHQGARQHYSPSSSHYRRLASAFVRKLAGRYGHHPALVAWHVNNEYACHMNECHNAESTRAFRGWLKKKYVTLDRLNQAWGAAFWSQLYHQWDEVLTPRRAPYHSNPTQQLDFKRFTSDAFLECYLMERAILKELTPEIPVTTNFIGFFKPLDYHRWAQEMDFVSWDSYPDPLLGHGAEAIAAAGNDLKRSQKKDTPFVLMEQAPAGVNWRPVNATKAPGVMRLQSLQAVARGGDGVMFFQWRASKAGAEKYHSAMIQHAGAEKTRTFREIKQLGAELAKLGAVAGTLVKPNVAIAFDWDAWWAVELESKPGRIDYAAWTQEIHRWFYEQNIAVDFVHPEEPLGAYALVVAPALYLLTKKNADNLTTYVREGGTLLATYCSAIVDENEHVVLDGYPGWLREVLGLWVEEWAILGDAQKNLMRFSDGTTVEAKHWCDVIHLDGAKALATFGSDFFAGHAAATEHDFGKGAAFYLGTKPDAAGLACVLARAVERAGVTPVLKTPGNVEVALREGGGKRFLFVLNHGDAPVEVPLAGFAGTELLSGIRAAGTLELVPLGAAVIAVDA
jgi:beta-galactosidase